MNESSKTNGLIKLVLPAIILTNAIAVTGQYLFIHDDWKWSLPLAIGAALSIESIAIAFAALASDAAIKGDNAFVARTASYAFGLLAGFAQVAHYAGHGAEGWILGAISASSPILWAQWSKRVSRDRLRETGDIQPRPAPMGLRWIVRTRDTVAVWKLAIWHGIGNPGDAIAAWETEREVKRAIQQAEEIAERETMTLETATTQADAIRIAFAELGSDAESGAIVKYLAEATPRAWTVSTARVRQVRAQMTRAETEQARSKIRALPGS